MNTNTYKKLFTISYNKKKFVLFLAENKRITFLEINDKEQFRYPSLEDFIYLNEIYNNKKFWICQDIPRFSYEEKVRLASSLLAINVIFNVFSMPLKKFLVNVNEDQVFISDSPLENERKVINIKYLEQLDDILGYKSIDKEVIHASIDNNPNIPFKYKVDVHYLLSSITELYPDLDLRIFYENIKTLEIYETTREEIHKEYPHTEAYYDPVYNRIVIPFDALRSTVYHEFSHTFYSYWREDDEKVVCRINSYGKALSEAMTNLFFEHIVDNNSYQREEYFLDYFISCVGFSVEEFHDEGIEALINKLYEFKTIDVNYIISSIDSMKDTYSLLGVVVDLEENIYLIDELFKICLERINIDSNNVYESFSDFAKMVYGVLNEEYVFNYLERYNDYLKKLGYNGVVTKDYFANKFKTFKDLHLVLIEQGKLPIPVLDDFFYEDNKKICYTLNEKGEKIKIVKELVDGHINYINVKEHLLAYMFKYPETIGTEAFWLRIFNEQKLVSPHLYNKINIYANNELIANDYLNDISFNIVGNKNGEIGYALNKEGKMLYCSIDDPQYQTHSDSLCSYFNSSLKWISKVDLEECFSQEKIVNYIADNYNYYSNIALINGKYEFVPVYRLNLVDDNTFRNIRDIYIDNELIANDSYHVNLYFYDKILPGLLANNLDLEINNRIYFDDVLRYYGLLKDERILTYRVEEIISLFTSYIEELNWKKEK